MEDYSPALRLELRKAKSRRDAYIKIHEDMGMKIPNFSQYVSNEQNYIKLGQYIRNLLNVSFETQKIGFLIVMGIGIVLIIVFKSLERNTF